MKNRFAAAGIAAAIAIAVAAGVLVPSNAATPGETVKKRQETMKKMGGHMKAIQTYLKTGDGTAADVVARAAEIAVTSMSIPTLFPEGSGMDAVKDPKTGAKPEIWLEWDKFTAAAKDMGKRAETLETTAMNGDRREIAAAFVDLGKNGCGGCHKMFRQKIER